MEEERIMFTKADGMVSSSLLMQRSQHSMIMINSTLCQVKFSRADIRKVLRY
jgi:hypothetical protein